MNSDQRLKQIWWTLRVTFGLVPIIAGTDKFFDVIAHWDMYLNPAVPGLLHLQPQTFMHIVGVIEICAGILVLTKFTHIASYIVAAWLVGISLNLVSQFAFLDVAVRDLVLAVCAFSLGRLTAVLEASQVVNKSSTTTAERTTQRAIA